jgi:cystathionine beta-lyase/cystathionine gamma-synthase
MPERFSTRLVHAGEITPRIAGAVTLPIFQNTVFEYDGGSAYVDIPYPRLGNLPNHTVLGRKLAALENGEAAVVTASGMAAITTALLTVAGGGHVIAQDCLYGGTHGFLTRLAGELGIAVDFVNMADPDQWKARLRPSTRVFYTEAITNPLVDVADHRAVVAFAREHGLQTMIDATFASPVVFRPIEIGYDVVLHSATKYLNGHSDLVAGAVISDAATIDAVRNRMALLGGSLDAHACYLLHRGLKTLELRVARQCESAMTLATFLAEHAAIGRVHYPGLPDRPGHAHARELFTGFGGMLAFEPAAGAEATARLLSRVRLPVVGPSLGGCETLLVRPAVTSHASLSPEERRRIGVGDALVRMSVGIEDVRDLVDDLAQALA